MALADRLLLHVVIWHQQDLLAREDFLDHHIVVGSDPTRADLCLSSEAIAAEHALLEHDGERVYVHDLGQPQAVYVNGVAVSRAQVRPTDEVQLGAHTLRMQVLHTAVAERLRQAVGQDELMVPPTPRPASLAAPPSYPLSAGPAAAPAWLLSHVPDATRVALLAPLPPEATRALEMPSRAQASALGLALLKVGQGLEDFRVVGRRYALPETYFRAGRYDAPVLVPSPLQVSRQVSRQSSAVAVAVVLSGAPWVLHRADGVYDEQAGIRESWAHRRHAYVHISMSAQDRLHVRVGAATYVVGMVPLAKRTRPTWKRPTWKRPTWHAWVHRLRGWAAGALTVLALALGASMAWAAHTNGSDRRMLAPPKQRAAAVLEGHFLPATGPVLPPQAVAGAAAAWPVDAASQNGRIGVPGGSRGYRLFGLLMPEPLADASQAPRVQVPVAADKAWLRGTERAWGKVLQAGVGGPPWLLDCDAQDVRVFDTKLQAPQVAQWLVGHADAWIACYAQTKPEKRQVRLHIALVLGAHGRVRSVRVLGDAGHAAWGRCLNAAKGAWRGPLFSGADVTVQATVTLWPWPS